MPPRKTTETQEWSVRVTPSDQEVISPADFEKELRSAELLIVCEEGEPNGKPHLHYHIYLKGPYSRTTLERCFKRLGRATAEVTGNAIYSMKQADTGTIGYTVKCRKVVAQIGYEQHTLNEYFEASEQYRKDLESSRRSKNRAKESSVKKIFETLVINNDTTFEKIIADVLSECARLNLPFPSRSSLETQTLRALYQFKPAIVNAFYLRNLDMLYK